MCVFVYSATAVRGDFIVKFWRCLFGLCYCVDFVCLVSDSGEIYCDDNIVRPTPLLSLVGRF